ncbi:MAG: FAD-binding oxidoreductase [Ilumatobacteraceae bacterium]
MDVVQQLEVVGRDGATYDALRAVFNGMIDRRPAMIVRCSSAQDVSAALATARENGLSVSVYGGGHGVTGAAVCDDGLCIDLRPMQGVEIDPLARTARVEGGATWGLVDAAAQEFGLAVTGGRISTTGVGGLTLGSGSGWLERSLGFTCDSLLAAEVVTADGRQVVASEVEHPDLFWALRGGGGNFGIVTAFHFRLHQVGPIVLGGMLLYPAAAGSELVRTYRDFMQTAPDAIGSGLSFITAPPMDGIPASMVGRPAIGIVVCGTGPLERAAEALRPLREAAPPTVDLVAPMPYVAVQQLLDDANSHGLRNHWSADILADLPDEAVDALVAHATAPVSPLTTIILIPGGGAPARVDDDATAFGARQAPWNVHFLSMWADPGDDERNIAYTRAIATAMKPWASGAVYLNYIGDEGAARIRGAFSATTYERLRTIKSVWDPDNVLHHNHNIPPGQVDV